MDATVPDYIFASALSAQLARSPRSSRRSSLRPSGLLTTPLSSPDSSPMPSPRTPSAAPTPDAARDDEIKEVIGYLHGIQRSRPQRTQLDMPRLIQF
ncbi:hypothetical protein H4R19_003544 [Coemansia spiralis]|nr:hypothetical protein H4R19_003544 [Coemansia spiralis]